MDNSFASVHPELVYEWSDKNAPLTPTQITYGSKKLYWWKGSCGHEWNASAKSRSSGEKCPYCAGMRVMPGFNDLASKRPDLVSEWSPKNELKPTEVHWSSHKKAIWRDKCGHEWEAVIKNRVYGSGCPYCSHNKILEGFNDLASVSPDVADEWSDRNLPLTPNMVTAFSNKKVWWKCKLGHEWNALISTRSYGSKCPYCSGIELLKGFNDLSTTQPELSKEWSTRNYPLSPEQVNEKSRLNVWWKCHTCGYEWKAVIHSRVHGSMCPVCAERSVLPGYNDLQTTDPELMSEWDFEKNQISPTQVSRYSMYSYWWKCRFGHSCKAKVSERTLEHMICPVCEKEYQAVFPQLIISYYAKQIGLRVVLNDEKLIGMPIETLIPEERFAIEAFEGNEKTERVKKHLCSSAGIDLIKAPYKKNDSELEYAERIKGIYKRKNLYIKSDTESDVVFVRKRYFEWKTE